MTDMLVLVDENDSVVGINEKAKCHQGKGMLHRAFTALLFDQSGRLVLTRRSSSKMLWPGIWDGTFASHPKSGESYAASAERRMPEEMGASCSMEYLFKFEYHVPYGETGSENEICGTLLGIVKDDQGFAAVPEEISEVRKATCEQILSGLKDDSLSYCPWMLIALYLLPEADKYARKKHNGLFHVWTEKKFRDQLQESIREHLPDENWRLVP